MLISPQLDGTGAHDLAALVPIRRTRHPHGCTAVDRARLSRARAAVAERTRSKVLRRSQLWPSMSGLVVSLPREPWATVVPIALLFPVLLWLAARCRPVFAAAAAFIVALTIVWTTTFGIGIFGDPSLPIADRILLAQAGILAVSLCAIVLAALFAERRQHAAALMESETRLQEALTAGAVTAFDWNVDTGLSRRSENAAQILGLDPQQPFNATQFLARVHPDDRARFKSLVRGVRPDSPSYSVTFRFIRPDGREVWLEETSRAEFDAGGRVVRHKGLTLDITERKRAEERQDRVNRRARSPRQERARTCCRSRHGYESGQQIDDDSPGHSRGVSIPWRPHTRC